MNSKKLKLPGIGLRIIKSAAAVGICYLVNLLRGDSGMVFYSQLAALWCIQVYRSNTINNAVQRFVGTVIGAVYGLIYLLVYLSYLKGIGKEELIEAVLISVLIVFVLYTTVLFNKKQASYFSCVVFLSIVINHSADMNPYLFVLNRFLDTMIGIVIGIVVNDARICIKPNRDILFISGLNDTLLDYAETLSAFSRVELNRMIDDGMKFTISTMRTPAVVHETMRDVRINLPVIAMDGAVLYDIRSNSYLKIYVISRETSRKVMDMILESGLCWYVNVIIDDLLVIYYDDTEDAVNRELVSSLRTSPFRNYVKRPMPDDESVTYFMLLDKAERIESFYVKLMSSGLSEELKIITYPSEAYSGYSYIKIFNRNATKDNMIEYLKQITGIDKVVTFGTIKDNYDVYVHSNDANEVVKVVRRMYEGFANERVTQGKKAK